jgi:hypothetical protein
MRRHGSKQEIKMGVVKIVQAVKDAPMQSPKPKRPVEYHDRRFTVLHSAWQDEIDKRTAMNSWVNQGRRDAGAGPWMERK